MPIENVSDTARWVAVYRAMETERADALFRDPFAAKLAGEKGFDIVKNMKRGKQMAWAMIVRTQSFDEIIKGVIREGADLVLNLAAGLDARPWRMELPPTLRWVDADLPGILNYKIELMKDEKPRCRYEAVTIDLTDVVARRALFARLGAESKRALVITEGLLIYLTPEDVGTLADALHEQPSFKWWLSDLASPMLLKMMKRMWGKPTAGANAPFRFAPEESTGFFAAHGWPLLSVRFSMDEARRLRREWSGSWFWTLLFKLYPKKLQEKFRSMSQIILLERR
jgi:methyltransferase (TIGR00027 family)